MKYSKSVVYVLGVMWMPMVPGATEYTVTGHDIQYMRDDDGKITRESAELWLTSHSGDFSNVTDFSASIEDGETTVTIPWADEDNEMEWGAMMYPDPDDDEESIFDDEPPHDDSPALDPPWWEYR